MRKFFSFCMCAWIALGSMIELSYASVSSEKYTQISNANSLYKEMSIRNAKDTNENNLSANMKKYLTESINTNKTYQEYIDALPKEDTAPVPVEKIEKPIVVTEVKKKKNADADIAINLSLSGQKATAPETIVLGAGCNSEPNIIGKTAQELYYLYGSNPNACGGLKRKLEPEDVKADFVKLIAFYKSVSSDKNIEKKAAPVKKEVKAPQSFGSSWLLINTKSGNKEELVISQSCDAWNIYLERLGKGLNPDYNSHKKEYKIKSLKYNSLDQVADKIIDGIKAEENKTRCKLIPAPMTAFNQVWDAIYKKTSQDANYEAKGYADDQNQYKKLVDPENVEPLKALLLARYVAIDFGDIEFGSVASVVEVGPLPRDIIISILTEINKGGAKSITQTSVSKALASVKLPEGWNKTNQGLQSPVSENILMNDIIKSVKDYAAENALQPEIVNNGAGAITESAYNNILEVSKGKLASATNDILTVCLHEGKTYQEYKNLLASNIIVSEEAPRAWVLDKERYNDLLVKSSRNSTMAPRPDSVAKLKMKYLGSLTKADQSEDSVDAKDKDKLAQALFEKKSYEQYVNSVIIEEEAVTASSSATPPQVASSQPEQEKERAEEPSRPNLADNFAAMAAAAATNRDHHDQHQNEDPNKRAMELFDLSMRYSELLLKQILIDNAARAQRASA